MSYDELLKRVHELEDLLGSHDILVSLAYTRLHYISKSRLEDAERLQVLLNKIVDTLNEEIT